MWFKYFNKEDWNLRMWKVYNLKFDANVYGATRNVYIAQVQGLLFKIFRGEGVYRFVKFWTTLSSILIYMALTEKSAAIKAAQEEAKEKIASELERQKYFKELKLNRYNKPTYPFTSMDSFMNFVTNGEAIKNTLLFGSDLYASRLQDDHAKGLDSWLSESDRALIEFPEQNKGGHH